MKIRVSSTPKMVERAVVIMVGKMISAGAALPKATRIPTMEVGISCMEVAFRTKSIAEEYSAQGARLRRFAARIP